MIVCFILDCKGEIRVGILMPSVGCLKFGMHEEKCSSSVFNDGKCHLCVHFWSTCRPFCVTRV